MVSVQQHHVTLPILTAGMRGAKKKRKKGRKKEKKRGNGHLPTALFASPLKGASKARQFGHPAIPVSNYR